MDVIGVAKHRVMGEGRVTHPDLKALHETEVDGIYGEYSQHQY